MLSLCNVSHNSSELPLLLLHVNSTLLPLARDRIVQNLTRGSSIFQMHVSRHCEWLGAMLQWSNRDNWHDHIAMRKFYLILCYAAELLAARAKVFYAQYVANNIDLKFSISVMESLLKYSRVFHTISSSLLMLFKRKATLWVFKSHNRQT